MWWGQPLQERLFEPAGVGLLLMHRGAPRLRDSEGLQEGPGLGVVLCSGSQITALAGA